MGETHGTGEISVKTEKERVRWKYTRVTAKTHKKEMKGLKGKN